jgi:hypothetical protein
MSNKIKSIGMAAYAAIGTATTFTELCTMDSSGGGKEAGIIELEPCLNETEIEQTVDLPKRKPITVVYKKLVGTAANISTNLLALVGTSTAVKYAVKYPTPNSTAAVYGRVDCLCTDHDDDSVTRGNYLTNTMVLVPTTEWTYSTTAPAT